MLVEHENLAEPFPTISRESSANYINLKSIERLFNGTIFLSGKKPQEGRKFQWFFSPVLHYIYFSFFPRFHLLCIPRVIQFC